LLRDSTVIGAAYLTNSRQAAAAKLQPNIVLIIAD
jgi:hypothetical protein